MAGKICVIMSAVQGNGSKYLATNLASAVTKKHKTHKVLLIDFDFDNPYLAHAFTQHDDVHGLDNLANSITSDGITSDLFAENVIETKLGIDVLRGTRYPEKSKLFTEQHVLVILEHARTIYDYVYVVVNPKANNAGTIFTLMNADRIMLVLRNNFSNMEKVGKALKVIRQYAPSKEMFVLYNYKNLHATASINQKFENDDAEILGVLAYEEKGIDNLNLMKRDSMFGGSVNEKEFIKINNRLWNEKGAKK